MTALVGVLCKNGVVIGADSSATFAVGQGFRTIEQKVKKIEIISDEVIVAGTGEIGLGQRFCLALKQSWGNLHRVNSPVDVGREFCKVGLKDFEQTKVAANCYGGLVAFPCGGKGHLCELQLHNFQPEIKTENLWFVSMGSGQPITDPFLGLLKRVFWAETQPVLNEGVFAVAWTLQHVIELNPGGINGPPQIAVLELSEKGKPRATLLEDSAIDEHLESVRAAEKHLGSYKDILNGKGQTIPEPPKPIVQLVPKAPSS